MFVAAALIAVTLVPSALAWVGPPAAGVNPERTSTEFGAMKRSVALRDFSFLTLTGSVAVGLVAQVGFLVHQVAFLQSVMGTARAGLAVALTTMMAVVGRVALGPIIDRFDPRRTTSLTFAWQAAVLAAMALTTDVTYLLILCCIFGFSAGNILTLPQLVIQREFAPASFGTLVALASSIVTLVAAVGPALIGLVRDATGGYQAGLLLCAALDAVCAAVVLLRSSPVRR
jgi:cyanate permease